MRLAPIVPFTVGRVTIRGGMGGVADTLGVMRQLAREGSTHAPIRDAAVRVIWMQPEKDQMHEARSIFEFVRDHIRYIRDPVMFEAVATPINVLRLGYGDCDDKSTLLAAMFESVGYMTRFVVAGYQSNVPEHVYVQVHVNGRWIDCDATEHEAFGFSPPNPQFIAYEEI